MKQGNFPSGWDENRVHKVLAHYEAQTEDEATAEDEAAFEDQSQTFMEVPKRLLKNDVSPSGRDGHAQDKDAKSGNSSAIHATEDAVSRRTVRSGGRDFIFQQPSSALVSKVRELIAAQTR